LENRKNETLGQPISINLILVDITNKVILQEEVTNHEILRKATWRDLENYTKKMVNQMNKGRKRSNNYEIGDLVWIFIPKIDHFGTDCPTLLCKILEKIPIRNLHTEII